MTIMACRCACCVRHSKTGSLNFGSFANLQLEATDNENKKLRSECNKLREIDSIRAQYKVILIDAIATMNSIGGDDDGYGDPDLAIDFLCRYERLVELLKRNGNDEILN